MTIEAASLMRRRRSSDGVGHVDKMLVKKKRRRVLRIRLRRMLSSSTNAALQELFHCCTHLFKGAARPSTRRHCYVKKMCRILDCMRPEDVGLSRDLHFFKPKAKVEAAPRVTSATIYKCDNFELCIFFLPANAVIPLHNHPEMTVFSKLLVGTMHIKAYDWFDSDDDYSSTSPPKLKLAKLKVDKMFTAPCNTSVLYPTSGGNIHEFRAVTPCAVLDVIGPPYSKDDGRDCSFYKEIPCETLLDKAELITKMVSGCYRWLEEIEIPKESEMDGIEYMGPQIID